MREREQWLVARPDRAGHRPTAELDAAWTSWLRGHRRALGFVTLVLG